MKLGFGPYGEKEIKELTTTTLEFLLVAFVLPDDKHKEINEELLRRRLESNGRPE